MRIFATLLDRPLGECILRCITLGGIKAHFDDAHLTVYFHNDRAYKLSVLALCPWIDETIVAPVGAHLPVEMFYPHADRIRLKGSDEFIGAGYSTPDLFVTSSMMTVDKTLTFDHVPYMSVPKSWRDALDEKLLQQYDVDPDRPIVTMYCR